VTLTYLVTTEKGADWIDSQLNAYESPGHGGLPSYIVAILDNLAGEEGGGIIKPEEVPPKSVSFLLKHGYAEVDNRTPYELVRDIGRYDRDLGKLLKTYVDIGMQKPVRDEHLDEALLIGIEKLRGDSVDYRQIRRGLEGALRSDSRPLKISALDTWVSMAHRHGLLDELGDPYVVLRDAAIVFDRLAEE